ncbi:MAG: DoxX family protein [Bacteroidales bacterium]|nr:DoxX family protein [Bacteroidales bacterium]
MKAKKIIFTIISVAIGLFFIASAILKIFTIKEFELYIYSYGIFNYTLCTLFARCLIAFEMCAGLCLALKWWYRLTWWLMQLSLLGFTVFLIFAQLRGDANCHCMGDFVELNPLQSMIKNFVIMALLLVVRNQENWNFRFEKIVKPLIVIIVATVPFIVAPPEVLYNKIYSSDRNINTPIFEKALTDSTFYKCYPIIRPNYEYDSTTFVAEDKPLELTGRNILMFAHAGCKYCREGAKRMSMFFRENRFDRNRCKIMIFGNYPPLSTYEFIKETEGFGFEYRENNPITSLDIVDGEFPTFMLMQDDSIVKSFDLWGLEESTIKEFLENDTEHIINNNK